MVPASDETEDIDVEELLDRLGFDPDAGVLTRRQAEVLALRERGISQAAVADRLGTSRANVSSVEASARRNVSKAHETVAFAEALAAPVRVPLESGSDIYDVPDMVYSACDEAGVKVSHPAAELMKHVREAAEDAVQSGTVTEPLLVGVTRDGDVYVRRER